MRINGEYFKEIRSRQLTSGKVCVSADGSKYLRMGDIKDILDEALYVQELYHMGFPVPEVLEWGQIGRQSYYIEQSIGKVTFGHKFKKEYLSRGKVANNTLKSFCDIVCIYLSAQLNSPSNQILKYNLKKVVMLSNILQENPDLDLKKVKDCLRKIRRRLSAFPNVFSHGDFTPRNIFNKGIIDFEFRAIAPVGFDVLTAPLIERFWFFQDKSGKTYEMFFLNKNQIDYYLDRVDNVAKRYGLDYFLSFVDDFLLIKAFWMLAHEKEFAQVSNDPSKWNFRKKILIYSMECYLNSERIDVDEFMKFGKLGQN